ncbi:MAG: dephospho-CoA kinase [Gilvibacter sp.]
MKIIGLTGGIGSGKSTVASFFKNLGAPVYIADIEAKALMNRSKVIRRKLIALFGPEAYNEQLNAGYIAGIVFKDASKLEALNSIVHPKVASHFKRWVKKQKGAFVIKEAAILFENGGYKKCDKTILVTAPSKIRVERVMRRDGSNRDQVLQRMQHQWPDSKKIPLADFVIENIDLEETKNSVETLFSQLSALKK